MRYATILTVGVLAVGLTGCTTAPYLCTMELRASLEVDVFDAQTGGPAAEGATVLLRGSAYQDSVSALASPSSPARAALWWEDRVKAGTYTVTIRKPGYVEWTQSNIRVTGGRCHVTSLVQVRAALQRLSS